MTMTHADIAGEDDGVVTPRADNSKRRRFTAEYKAQVLAEYEAADRAGRGMILRRENLYSSHVVEWRKQLAASAREGVPSPKSRSSRDREVAQLRARAEAAEAELARTQAALDLVGKAHALLELLSESADTPKQSPR